MRIHQDWQWIEPGARGTSVAIGNFDGVHLGHKAVIDLARAHGPLGVVTFEPHPREVFAPDAPPFRLMNAASRAHELEALGVEQLFQLRFDRLLSSLAPEEFAREILADGLGIRHAVIGEDFRFGNKRAGGADDLRRLGGELGFGTTVAPLLSLEGVKVSSTAIRAALSEGRPRDAARMLGHPHRIAGEVLHGDKRGRKLGFPTANMALAGLHLPRFGVYAVRVDVLGGPHAGSYLGAASLGLRPMFNGDMPNLETYLLDFRADIYGQQLSVALVDFIRPEERFADVPDLIRAMTRDVARAREILAA